MSNELFFIESLHPLYEDVQSAGIFPDSKFFVDAAPRASAEEILQLYSAARKASGFDLRSFISSHFILPQDAAAGYTSANKPIDRHLRDLWNFLKREPSSHSGTLIPLPHPYIIPGGRFREIYYWDSYFTMLGLQVCGETEMIVNMVDNFAALIREIGFIPNGNRTYYLGRSQPPFFALMLNLLVEEKGHSVLSAYGDALEREYAFWMDGEDQLSEDQPAYRRVVRLPEGLVANRYWDDQETPRPEAYTEDRHIAKRATGSPLLTFRNIRAAAESGWDFSSRWFADGKNMHTIQTTSLIPVDLNCLMLNMETMLHQWYHSQANTQQVRRFEQKIHDRKKMIHAYCWNNKEGFYFDYNHVERAQATGLSLAALYPLFFHVATPEQAAKAAEIIENKFLYRGGLVTTPQLTGQQWDAPNGWAPLQWITYRGLQHYGYTNLAATISDNWTKNCERVYTLTGKMMEKYNVIDTAAGAGGGEYPNQDGFGWTNGVYLKMMAEKTK